MIVERPRVPVGGRACESLRRTAGLRGSPATARRRFCLGVAGGIVGAGIASAARGGVRIGLTPVFLDDRIGFLWAWQRYLEAALQTPVEFVQRGSYRDIIDLVLRDEVQFAWLCGYPYVRHRDRLRLLAVPVYRGQPLYQSYLIVPARDTYTRALSDLRQRVFAYADPDSNSGFLYPQYQLIADGSQPQSHFRRTFFTYGHRSVVAAVAARIAHGGAVDGYIWEALAMTHPELVRETRIVQRSPEFGFPPLVAAPGVGRDALDTMRSVIHGMHRTIDGAALLARLHLDRFDEGSPQLFDGIERMALAVRTGRA